MTTLYDHRTDPPIAYTAARSCVLIDGVSVPVANPPAGIYADGGSDPVPAGAVATAWTRVVRDGTSVRVPTCEPAPPATPTPADEARARYAAMLAQLGIAPGATEAEIEAAVEAIADPDTRHDAGLRLAALAVAVLNRGGTL